MSSDCFWLKASSSLRTSQGTDSLRALQEMVPSGLSCLCAAPVLNPWNTFSASLISALLKPSSENSSLQDLPNAWVWVATSQSNKKPAMHSMVSAEEKRTSPSEFRQVQQVKVPGEFKLFTSKTPVTWKTGNGPGGRFFSLLFQYSVWLLMAVLQSELSDTTIPACLFISHTSCPEEYPSLPHLSSAAISFSSQLPFLYAGNSSSQDTFRFKAEFQLSGP